VLERGEMRDSTIREYEKELQESFDLLSVEEPEILEGLGVTDDFDGFKLELAMQGLEAIKKSRRRKKNK
jgi:hypothetical protein